MFGQGLNFGGLTGSAGFDAYYLVTSGKATSDEWGIGMHTVSFD